MKGTMLVASTGAAIRGRPAVSILAAALLVLLIGCSGHVSRRWTEAVRLDDGTVIVILRSAEFEQSNSWGGDAYGSKEIASTIVFRGAQAGLPSWNAALVPLLIYRDTNVNEWVVVATTNSCEIWRHRGKPIHAYWEYRYRKGAWTEVPIAPGSFGRQSNLFFSYEEPMQWPFVSLEMKEEILARESIDQSYKSILEKYRPGCG